MANKFMMKIDELTSITVFPKNHARAGFTFGFRMFVGLPHIKDQKRNLRPTCYDLLMLVQIRPAGN